MIIFNTLILDVNFLALKADFLEICQVMIKGNRGFNLLTLQHQFHTPDKTTIEVAFSFTLKIISIF